MPIVQITLLPGRSNETKALIGAEITRILAEVAGAPTEATTVVFTEAPGSDWIVAGKPLAPD